MDRKYIFYTVCSSLENAVQAFSTTALHSQFCKENIYASPVSKHAVLWLLAPRYLHWINKQYDSFLKTLVDTERVTVFSQDFLNISRDFIHILADSISFGFWRAFFFALVVQNTIKLHFSICQDSHTIGILMTYVDAESYSLTQFLTTGGSVANQ